MRVIALASLLMMTCGMAVAEPLKVTLTLRDHHFVPSTLTVPAGQEFEVELINEDGVTEEFDSLDLNIEVDVTPKNRTHFKAGPLRPGSYDFVGEYHAQTAKGVILAVE
jgi:plastocyanin